MKYWALILLVAITFKAMADDGVSENERVDFFDSQTFDILNAGAPLVVAGFAFKPACKEFQNMRNSYCSDVRFYADDYLQYVPAAIMTGLKLVGVESRSSWGRMLVSDAITVSVGSIIINSVKHTANVHRPDSNANTSLPSGHTATAFMVATMLHKEYGMVSPWYSIAGYSIAATSGVMRVINNQHWVSDILVGAGIGIIATELGYYLADLIYKDRGINRKLDDTFVPSWDNIASKSSLGFYLGVATPLNQLSSSATLNMGSKIGIELSHLFNNRFGLGADISMSNFSIDMNGETLEQSLDIISANIGGYYAQPISNCWRIGAKAIAGMDYYKECRINDELNIGEGARSAFGAGLSIEYLTNRHWSIKAFGDYNAAYLKELPKKNLHQRAIFGMTGNIIF